MNVPNETCLSNTRNYTNINKHYCVSTTVSAATVMLTEHTNLGSDYSIETHYFIIYMYLIVYF